MTTFEDIKEMLVMIKEDESAPRNVVEKVNSMIDFIDNVDKDVKLKVDALQQEIEEITNDINIPSFIRTQFWAVSGALENIE